MVSKTIIFDIEGDGFLETIKNIWVCCLEDYDTGEKKVCLDRESLIDEITEGCTLVGHNILGYDLPALFKVWGIDYSVSSKGDTFNGLPVRFVDTFQVSQYLNADREGGHSLESFGDKIQFNDFSKLSEEMITYCQQDVNLNCNVFEDLEDEAYRLGVDLSGQAYEASRLTFHVMGRQAWTGIHFDQEGARKLLEYIASEMKEIADRVEPGLPARSLKASEKKDYTLPAKPFKKDGTLSSHMERFLERHGVTVEGKEIRWLDGNLYSIKAKEELPFEAKMALANQDDLKEWLMSLGWVPTLWNVKKSNGKPVRDDRGRVIRTSPKIQENKVICPNLEAMDLDIIKDIVRWMSLRNREGVINGWLEDPRLPVDGRLSAGSYGIANTHRQRHTTVVNLPKAQDDVILGKEVRSLFTARPGRVLLGFDAKSLEGRVEAHYTFPYDKGEYARELLSGDIHSINARVFFPEETRDLKDTDDEFKYYRSLAKNGKYALTYGAQPPKLASTLRLPESQGQLLYDAFLEKNWALARLKERVENFWTEKSEKSYILGIDGRKVRTRSRHSLINTLFQHAGAVIMDYSALILSNLLGGERFDNEGYPCFIYKGHTVYRVAYMHDEFVYDLPEEIAEEIGELARKSIIKAGEVLKLNVPLDADVKTGNSWADIH